ncbi:MAG: hypothetical protein ACO23R_14555 [bacterium]
MEKVRKADQIRAVAQEVGYHHSNKHIEKEVMRRFGVVVSPQQVSQVLGLKKARTLERKKDVYRAAVRYLAACQNDISLAKSILLELIHPDER